MKRPIVGTMFVGLAVSLVVGALLGLGDGDSRVISVAIIIGFIGTLLR